MIVLDASVVVDLITNGILADSIRNELGRRDESVIVPHLVDVEVMSALRRLVAGQRIDSHREAGNFSQSSSHCPLNDIRTRH